MNAIAPDIAPNLSPGTASATSAAAVMLWDVIRFTHAQLELLHRRDMAVIAEEIRLLEAGEPLPKQRRDPTVATSRLVRILCTAVTLHARLEAGTSPPAPRPRPPAKPPADPRRDLLRTALREASGVPGNLPGGLCRAIDAKVDACLAADPNGPLPLREAFAAMCVELGFPLRRGPAAPSVMDRPLPFPAGHEVRARA